MSTFTNRLAKETSPYLLQHAHNPVDWYPWGEEALQKARTENKPILVSIGYAACHWCHVMEKESFEDMATATIMNEHFVNIKIDREERPDLDHIYMDAVQAMTGSGGWPLNVFLTPEAKPFYGGTYFPPKPVHNRPSWQDVLHGVANAFQGKRKEINDQAENLTAHILQSNNFGLQSIDNGDPLSDGIFNKQKCDEMFAAIMQSADKQEGGFGRAPKFPQTFTIRFLLHYHYYTGNQEALQQACLSLDKMIYGGLYDQVGGGFARYSTDSEWLAPHFEKMLYDNALLVSVLCEAYQLTKKEWYKRTIEQTLAFVERELFSPEDGFYSALDADSEGEEGKFYVWSRQEVEEVLGADAALFNEVYDVTEHGNWEHTNILRLLADPEETATAKHTTVDGLWKQLDHCLALLLERRNTRVRPLLDDKQLLGWNALMNEAYCRAYAALGNEHYLNIAKRNMAFMLQRFAHEDGTWLHTYKAGQAKYPAFLDDLALLVQALIRLQEVTGDKEYLQKARQLTQQINERFSEQETGFFFFTPSGQGDIIVRKKEVYDGAVPSGNSIMAVNLYYLGIVFDETSWKERAVSICASLHQVATRYPTSFGIWAALIQAISNGVPEIAIIGPEVAKLRQEFLRHFIPFSIVQSATHDLEEFPLLSKKPYSPETQIFLCKNYACQQPVTEVDTVLKMMR